MRAMEMLLDILILDVLSTSPCKTENLGLLDSAQVL
jgi:hypothetical protein